MPVDLDELKRLSVPEKLKIIEELDAAPNIAINREELWDRVGNGNG